MLSSAVRRQVPTASLDERDAFQFRYSLGVEARDLGIAEAARKWNVTYWKAWYWLEKLQGAHPGLHGGHRYQTLTPEAQIALEWSVFLLWEADPNLQDVEIVRILKYELGWTWLDDGTAGIMIYTGVGTAGQRGELGSYWEGTFHPRGGALLSVRLANGLLVAGDNLVLDNAKIHYAAAIKPLLHALLPALGANPNGSPLKAILEGVTNLL
eukprot:g22453.t1